MDVLGVGYGSDSSDEADAGDARASKAASAAAGMGLVAYSDEDGSSSGSEQEEPRVSAGAGGGSAARQSPESSSRKRARIDDGGRALAAAKVGIVPRASPRDSPASRAGGEAAGTSRGDWAEGRGQSGHGNGSRRSGAPPAAAHPQMRGTGRLPPADRTLLPPRPAGEVSDAVLDKMQLLQQHKANGIDITAHIQGRKSFRNPSIYDKLIDRMGIDETGTNYPPEIYDPAAWTSDDFFEAIDQARLEYEREKLRAKAGRSEVEFVRGSSSSTAPAAGGGAAGGADALSLKVMQARAEAQRKAAMLVRSSRERK